MNDYRRVRRSRATFARAGSDEREAPTPCERAGARPMARASGVVNLREHYRVLGPHRSLGDRRSCCRAHSGGTSWCREDAWLVGVGARYSTYRSGAHRPTRSATPSARGLVEDDVGLSGPGTEAHGGRTQSRQHPGPCSNAWPRRRNMACAMHPSSRPRRSSYWPEH